MKMRYIGWGAMVLLLGACGGGSGTGSSGVSGAPTPAPEPAPSPPSGPTLPAPAPAPAPVPVPPPGPAPAPSPTPAPTPAPAPSAPPAPSAGFPDASNTGVPVGTVLSPYTGPCTITVANAVIDAKEVRCALDIRASGVSITRSLIMGTVAIDAGRAGASFSISDSTVDAGSQEGTGIGERDFVARRVHVKGGNRSINCYLKCTVEDSYVHGQFRDATGRAHESGIRMGSDSTLRRNTIVCDAPDVAPDAGCSASLTGYGDFDVVQRNLIEGNYFPGTSGGYCAYGGSTRGKPFSAGVNNIRFINNVFGRGSSGNCGVWGPITSFDSNAPGNVWSGNTWTDGKPVPPAD